MLNRRPSSCRGLPAFAGQAPTPWDRWACFPEGRRSATGERDHRRPSRPGDPSLPCGGAAARAVPALAANRKGLPRCRGDLIRRTVQHRGGRRPRCLPRHRRVRRGRPKRAACAVSLPGYRALVSADFEVRKPSRLSTRPRLWH